MEKSRDLFIKAYELAVKHNEDNYAIDAAHMLGIIEPYKEAQEWNELAIKLTEKTKDEKAKKKKKRIMKKQKKKKKKNGLVHFITTLPGIIMTIKNMKKR